MFEKDGIVYAGEPEDDIKVSGASYAGNLCLLVTFSTGETRLLDTTELTSIPAFKALSDERVCRAFSIEHGVLTWEDGQIDMAPETLYKRTYPYAMTA